MLKQQQILHTSINMSSPSSESNQFSFNSKDQVVELSVIWTIENASLRFTSCPCLEHKTVYSNDKTQKWNIFLTLHSNEFLSPYLTVECKDVVRAKYSICIIDKNGGKYVLRDCPCMDFINEKMRGEGLHKDLTMKELLSNDSLFPDDKLTLYCEIKAITISNHPSQARFSVPDNYRKKWSMLVDPKFTDVVLIVQGREIKALKAMLAAHSSVFAAMFNSNMTESSQNRVAVFDFDYDVIEQMLLFIYTDRATNLNQMAERLLDAAEEYDLERLKIVCEQSLCDNLTVDNALKMLALAKFHNADNLASHASKIVALNITNVMQTADWDDMFSKWSLATVRD